MVRRIGFVASAVLLLAATLPARADDVAYSSAQPEGTPSAVAMTGDLLVVRPLSLVATGLGCAIYLLSAPITVWQKGGIDSPYQRLVVEPARFTFDRPLGASH